MSTGLLEFVEIPSVRDFQVGGGEKEGERGGGERKDRAMAKALV